MVGIIFSTHGIAISSLIYFFVAIPLGCRALSPLHWPQEKKSLFPTPFLLCRFYYNKHSKNHPHKKYILTRAGRNRDRRDRYSQPYPEHSISPFPFELSKANPSLL